MNGNPASSVPFVISAAPHNTPYRHQSRVRSESATSSVAHTNVAASSPRKGRVPDPLKRNDHRIGKYRPQPRRAGAQGDSADAPACEENRHAGNRREGNIQQYRCHERRKRERAEKFKHARQQQRINRSGPRGRPGLHTKRRTESTVCCQRIGNVARLVKEGNCFERLTGDFLKLIPEVGEPQSQRNQQNQTDRRRGSRKPKFHAYEYSSVAKSAEPSGSPYPYIAQKNSRPPQRPALHE